MIPQQRLTRTCRCSGAGAGARWLGSQLHAARRWCLLADEPLGCDLTYHAVFVRTAGRSGLVLLGVAELFEGLKKRMADVRGDAVTARWHFTQRNRRQTAAAANRSRYDSRSNSFRVTMQCIMLENGFVSDMLADEPAHVRVPARGSCCRARWRR
jgi:hypothetical protein